MCKFQLAWVGDCQQQGEPMCEKHAKLKCVCCEEPATHQCEETMGPFVCGYDLCDKCTHTLCSNGCNQGEERPPGYGGHCRKDQQVFKGWFEDDAKEHNQKLVEQYQEFYNQEFEIGDEVIFNPNYFTSKGQEIDETVHTITKFKVYGQIKTTLVYIGDKRYSSSSLIKKQS